MTRVALLVLVAAFAATLLPGPWGDERVTDLPLFSAYADAFLDGALPYRDVSFEYPPLAAPLLALPGVFGGGEEGYRVAFGALALGAAAAIVLLVGALALRTGGSRRRAMLAAAAAPLVCGAMIRTHFDLVPVALTLGALALLCANRPRSAFAVLGAGAALKLYPLVVAPVALAWLVSRGHRRAAVDALAALALVVLVAYGAAALLSGSGTLDSLSYHVERPVQVESTPAAVLNAVGALGDRNVVSVQSHRSNGITHPADDLVVVLFGAALLGVLALLAGGAARGGGDPRELVLASLAATVAFATLGKVLSPQFLVWAVPLGALALAWRMHLLAVAVGAACLLTLMEFPVHYGDVVAREPLWLALVALRDAILLAAVALALRALGPAQAAAAAATVKSKVAV